MNNCVVDSAYIGFAFAQDSVGTAVTIRECRFRGNFEHCVSVQRGNSLHATACIFTGAGSERGRALVSASESIIDSCQFSSAVQSSLLYCWSGRHSVTNCTFGPVYSHSIWEGNVVDIGNGAIHFMHNEFIDCVYNALVVDIRSNLGDSVNIGGNCFTNCVGVDSTLTPRGVMSVWLEGDMQHGAFIHDNVFTGSSSNAVVDDIMIVPFSPALLVHNIFTRDSVNGLPSIFAGNPVWEQTPVTLNNNVWEDCGYAAALSAAADARFNYWGDPSGPYHETANPSGSGDTITGPVPFVPWLEDTTTSIGELPNEVLNDHLVESYPNPFNSTVTIEFALTREQNVYLEVFDVLGRQVATLLNERRALGVHHVLWNADGQASGLYFARLSSPDAPNTAQSVKLLLLK
jgi:hypothetical protein